MYKIPFSYNQDNESISFTRPTKSASLILQLWWNENTKRWYLNVFGGDFQPLFTGLKVWYSPDGIGGILLQKTLDCKINVFGNGVIDYNYWKQSNFCLVLEEL